MADLNYLPMQSLFSHYNPINPNEYFAPAVYNKL